MYKKAHGCQKPKAPHTREGDRGSQSRCKRAQKNARPWAVRRAHERALSRAGFVITGQQFTVRRGGCGGLVIKFAYTHGMNRWKRALVFATSQPM